jgi:hypothetical protein
MAFTTGTKSELPISNEIHLLLIVSSSFTLTLFSSFFLQEMDDTISDVDPQAVDQLVESLSKDLEDSDLQFNHEGYNPVAGTLAFGRMSTLNFSHGNPAPSHQVIRWGDEEVQSINLKVLEKSNAKASSSRTPHYAEEHVLAERKRREKLSQQFLALATLVPELKKVRNSIEITV